MITVYYSNCLEQGGNSKLITGASAAHATVYEDLATLRDHGNQISNEYVLTSGMR